MNISKRNFKFVSAALICGTYFLSTSPALTHADVVYDTTTGGTDYIDQQTGNNYYYIGDTATITPTAATLTTISIPFGTSYYNGSGVNGPGFTYTPDLTLDLYPSVADAATGTDRFGTAEVNNVTFTNDGIVDPVSDYNYEDEQLVTFDFSSQNIVLPTTFAFAYHDNATLDSNGGSDGANGLSVGLTTSAASVGTSIQDYFQTYPNAAPSLTSPSGLDPYGPTSNLGINVEAQINVVPEPASFSIIGFGAAALLRRRRRLA